MNLFVVFVGGVHRLTTFSTFSNECLLFVREGRWGAFGLYVAASITLGIAAVFAGWCLGR